MFRHSQMIHQDQVLATFQHHQTICDTLKQFQTKESDPTSCPEEWEELVRLQPFLYYYYLLEISSPLEELKNQLERPIESFFVGPTIPMSDHVLQKTLRKIDCVFNRTLPQHSFIEQTRQLVCCEPHEFIHDKNIAICTACGREQVLLHAQFSYSDSERIHVNSKYSYTRRIHFRDCIKAFQGKENCSIAPELYEQCEEYLRSYHLVDESQETQRGRYRLVTKNHVMMFLKQYKFTKHFENLNLIFHHITDQPLYDISHLEKGLMSDFNQLSDLYDQHFLKEGKTDRKSFISTQYILYQLLRKHKFPCELSDFHLLKTIERRRSCDTICAELFKRLEWNFQGIS